MRQIIWSHTRSPTELCSRLFLFSHLFLLLAVRLGNAKSNKTLVDVGVVLDFETWFGKMSWSCINMAHSDFYATHNYTTRLVLHPRDSKNDTVGAASAGLDLMKNVQVKAIVGPQTSAETAFLINMGDKSHVPIISFSATSPSLSTRSPYFIRTVQSDSAQVTAVSALVRAFGWKQVVPIYEDTEYGNGIIPYLIDALQATDSRVPYRSVLSPTSTDDRIFKELHKLKSMQTRVFVVHMVSSLKSRLFSAAKEIGLFDGCAWIITDGIANLLDSIDPSVIESMQGVIGVRQYVPKSKELGNFKERWKKKMLSEYTTIEGRALSVFGLWAYDTVWALAKAVEMVGASNSNFAESNFGDNSTDLATLGVSLVGPKLLNAILHTRFSGLSGEFNLVNGQLQSSAYEIINLVGKSERVIGFWTPKFGLSRVLDRTNKTMYSASIADLKPAIWPGDTTAVPKGLEKLKIGVPKTYGSCGFVKVECDPKTKTCKVTGFTIDVFKAVLRELPYALPHEFVPFAGTYDDLVHQVYLQKFDAVVGDITIRADRSLYVDFTMPYTESGVSMIVPIKDDERKNAWIFLKPLSRNLWLTSGAVFICTGFVVWVLEHRINEDFRGPPSHQVGVIFWFSFSTLVFAHKEKVVSNLARFVVIIWVFVVLILTSSYTASLTSMLTVQQLHPTVTDINELLKNGDYVGYGKGSFVGGMLKRMNFDEKKLKDYDTIDEYAEALTRGSQNGGVSAIFEEIPYIKLFLAKHCNKYTMVGPTYKTDGFGFAFPRGSPLVPDVSRAVLKVTEGKQMEKIEKNWMEKLEKDWIGQHMTCPTEAPSIKSNSLTLDSFWGLFLIAGIASGLALIIFLVSLVYKKKHVERQNSRRTVWQRIVDMARYFDERDLSSHTFRKTRVIGGAGVLGNTRYAEEPTPGSYDPQSRLSDFSGLQMGSRVREDDEGISSSDFASPNLNASPDNGSHMSQPLEHTSGYKL